MPLIPLQLPPGIYRNGTLYQTKGRWYNGDLTRFIEGTVRPVGGWQTLLNLSGTAVTVSGAPRAMKAWRSATGAGWLGIGTNTKLYAFSAGTLNDITPVGLVTGGADATQSVGLYGGGNYGAGVYGTGGSGVATTTDPAIWQLDTFGQFLVGVLPVDGKCYSYNLSGTAAQMAGSPTGCSGIVVTPERFIFALGAGGDGRVITWPDQGSQTNWSQVQPSQGGTFTLSTDGILRCGRRGRGETLLWTDIDLWVAQYIGGTLIYSFRRVAENCGIIGPQAVAMVDGRAIWMGQRGFFVYDGTVREIPCEISDYIFSDFNSVQKAKVYARVVAEFGEVHFHYCSGSSTAINRYVIYNYRENHWNIGGVPRSCGVDRGVFTNPILGDESGNLWEHEVGHAFPSYSGTPFIESGPFELSSMYTQGMGQFASGDQIFMVRQLIPDDKTVGDVNAYIYTSFFPDDTETLNGPYTLSKLTDVRLSARQMRLKLAQVNAVDWRVGTPRLDGALAGRR